MMMQKRKMTPVGARALRKQKGNRIQSMRREIRLRQGMDSSTAVEEKKRAEASRLAYVVVGVYRGSLLIASS